MVRPADDPCAFHPYPIGRKLRVHVRRSIRSHGDAETDSTGAHSVPVDVSLKMRHVYALNGKATRTHDPSRSSGVGSRIFGRCSRVAGTTAGVLNGTLSRILKGNFNAIEAIAHEGRLFDDESTVTCNADLDSLTARGAVGAGRLGSDLNLRSRSSIAHI